MDYIDSKQFKALVVDDEPEVREIIVEYLKDKNIESIEAQNGEEALRLFKENDIDIVLSDIKMPVKDGIEFFKSFINLNQNIPFIFITANPKDAQAINAIKMGAYDIIEKPFIMDLVYASIERALNKRRFNLDTERQIKEYLDERGIDLNELDSTKSLNAKISAGKIIDMKRLKYSIDKNKRIKE